MTITKILAKPELGNGKWWVNVEMNYKGSLVTTDIGCSSEQAALNLFVGENFLPVSR